MTPPFSHLCAAEMPLPLLSKDAISSHRVRVSAPCEVVDASKDGLVSDSKADARDWSHLHTLSLWSATHMSAFLAARPPTYAVPVRAAFDNWVGNKVETSAALVLTAAVRGLRARLLVRRTRAKAEALKAGAAKVKATEEATGGDAMDAKLATQLAEDMAAAVPSSAIKFEVRRAEAMSPPMLAPSCPYCC